MKRRTVVTAIFLVSIAPSALYVSRAMADDEDEAPQAGEALTSEEISKKRREALLAMTKDDTVLINVSQAEMPGSPDILNLGRKGTKALARCVSDNVDDNLRMQCAQMLGRLGDRGGLVALQGALEAWNSGLRRAAIDALRRMPDPSSTIPLSKILEREDEDEGNRAAALEALGAMSDPRATGIVRKALRSPPDEQVGLRGSAFAGLWKSRHLIPRGELVSDVQYALTSGDAGLELQGTFAASDLRAPELSTALIKLMQSPDTHIKNRAVYALGKIGDKNATRALVTQVPKVRESRMLNNIAFALERLDPQSFYATAKTLSQHKQAQIRMNTAFVLGDVRRPEGLPLLQTALDDKNDSVKLSAVMAMGKLDSKDAAPLLEKYVDDKNQNLKTAAIYSIYALSGFKRTDLVFDKLYPSTNPSIKLQAALELAKANDPRVTEDIVTCMEMRQCAVDQISPFLRASKSPEVPGRTLLTWVRGRPDLGGLIGEMKPAGAGPLARSSVQASLAHKDVLGALHAIDVTGDITDQDAIAVLRPLLAHENTRLRIHAAVALARANVTEADPVLFADFDNVPHEQLPSLVRLMSHVTEKDARARLTPELVKREGGQDVAIAVAAAAVHLAWDPENAFFRVLQALAAPTRMERDLAEKYLVRDDTATVTELLRRALAREHRDSTKDQLRRILDLRADRDRTP